MTRRSILACSSLVLSVWLGIAVVQPAAAQPAAVLQPGDLTVICGDSITQQKIYSVFIEDYLLMCRPAEQQQAVQLGLGGETAPRFLARLGNDALPFKPAAATIFYGMNDGGYVAADAGKQAAYRAALDGIVRTFSDSGVRVVVGSPGVVDTDTFKRNDPAVYNQTLAQLGAIGKEIATARGAAFADVHTLMLDAMAKSKAKYGNKYHLAGGDGIHPDANGHLVIAYAFLKALGCDGNIGAITYDQQRGQATADTQQKILSAAGGELTIESTRYPFCFFGEPDKTTSTSGIIEFIPFNQDLNRYTLAVTHATAAKLKVTWGGRSKTFAAAELQRGVNLAAEFLDNPFSAQFASVENLVKQQQAFETAALQKMLGPIADWTASFPAERAAFDQFRQTIYDLAAQHRRQAAAAVTPLRHTIKIEAAD